MDGRAAYPVGRCAIGFAAGLGLLALLQAPTAGRAEGTSDLGTAKPLLEQRLKAELPTDWQSRVSQRDGALVAFITPPTAMAFQVIYEPERQRELIARLCPPLDDAIWTALGPDQDVAIMPSVLGKSGVRVSCRTILGARPGA